MAGLITLVEPTAEPITLVQAKNFLRVQITDDDDLISGLITAAREMVEHFCNRSFVPKTYCMVLDCFPYYTDSVMSQLAYPPSYYALPMYSTTLWNYSQMIKLWMPPVAEVLGIDYTASDGTNKTLEQDTNFLLDSVSEPARVFPLPGQMWPSCLYCPNAVRIRYRAGYGDLTDVDISPIAGEISVGAAGQPIPKRALTAMYQLMNNWYENREAAAPGSMNEIPNHVKMLLWSLRVQDFQPTRG
jgi:hypothetical protein